MPIIFRSTPVREPLAFDSIGNHWTQEPVSRPNGYHHYHYLQSEKGKGEIEIQGRFYPLNEGEGVLIAPFLPHAYRSASGEWQTCFATFTGTIEDDIGRMAGGRSFIFTKEAQCRRIAQIIDFVIGRYQAPPADEKELSLCCYNLLLEFTQRGCERDLEKEELFRQYVAPVIKEIETHYEQELTVDQLSRKVFISPQYLSRLFERFLGCSTYEYLTACRINKAKSLLITKPHLKIQEVSHLCGFSSTSHFIVMFKRASGLTPLQFRKIN